MLQVILKTEEDIVITTATIILKLTIKIIERFEHVRMAINVLMKNVNLITQMVKIEQVLLRSV